MGAVTALLPLLVCDIPKIQQPALQCYASMSFQNGAVSIAMKSGNDQKIDINNLIFYVLFKGVLSSHPQGMVGPLLNTG